MVDHATTLKLLRAKVIASGCMKKTETILDIQRSWEIEEGEFDHFEALTTDIGLQCEYAIATFDAIVDATEQLLHSPPPYGSNPDGHRHRLLELQVLAGLAFEHAVEVTTLIERLREDAVDGSVIRLMEADRRASSIRKDAEELEDLTHQPSEGSQGSGTGGEG